MVLFTVVAAELFFGNVQSRDKILCISNIAISISRVILYCDTSYYAQFPPP